MTTQIKVNENKIEHCTSNGHGICAMCGAIKYDYVEPDATTIKCDECGGYHVNGFENAVLSGMVIPSSDKYPTLNEYKDKQ